MKRWLMLLTTSAAAISMPTAAFADTAKSDLPDRIELGRDARGEPCSAVRNWDDPALSNYFSVSYSITCRGATASRSLGAIRAFKRGEEAKLLTSLQCGDSKDFMAAGIGNVTAKKCVDSSLGFETLVTSFSIGGRTFQSSVTPVIQGPAEEGLRILARLQSAVSDRNRITTADVNGAALTAPQGADAGDALEVNPSVALSQGLLYIRQGLHMEASRILNDALGRLSDDAPTKIRIDLELVSALADSNLRFFDSADEHFAKADILIAQNPSIEDAALLARKRKTYSALDMLNRRNFTAAIQSLDQLVSSPTDANYPLSDSTIVRAINQSSGGSGSNAADTVAVPDTSSLSQIVVNAQANWARSVALLAQNKPEEARTALVQAERNFDVLRKERVDQKQILWLEARIERQRGRIAMRQGDVTTAIAALDRAISSLNRAGLDGSGIGPALAETELERAALLSRTNMGRAEILAEFDGAIDSLAASGSAGGVLPPAVEQYLDLLIKEAEQQPDGNAGEKFFRAIQAVGEPAVARQFTQLQTIISNDQSLAAKVQDRAEIERELTQLRFRSSVPEGGNQLSQADIEKMRSDAEARLIAIDQELSASNAFSAVDDKPAKISEIRDLLRNGEVYFKVTEVRNYAFGILIDPQGYKIYRLGRPMVDLRPLTDIVRNSIDGKGSKLPVYNVGASYALWTLIAGPVADQLLSAKSIIVDPSGPLENLPLGIFVTDKASVDSFVKSRAGNAYDYSKVNFLAKQVGISSALSPRSFIVSRNLPSSNAPQPFIGFAEHLPPPMSGSFGGAMISVGSGCIVEGRAIAALSNQLTPISRNEIDRAEKGLGIADAPAMTGAGFTDTEVKARTDLDQFQVLHFATHGLKEGAWGCAKSPPALVTSMGDAQSDGLLSFDEIAKLRLNANLVVLSACDTASGISEGQARGAGQEEAGATLQGLVRAFLAANTRAVLTTYWPISSGQESEELIETLYRTGRTQDISASLRAAQTDLMVQPKYSHPLYWGAFFIVGDGSRQMLTGTAAASVGQAGTPAL